MSLSVSALLLRIFHGLLLVYFVACISYIYFSAWFVLFDTFTLIAAVSLCAEGFAVYVLNNGDCPLVHVQRKLKDETPFFALIMPPEYAKQAIPAFSAITIVGMLALLIRLGQAI